MLLVYPIYAKLLVSRVN